MRVTSVSMLPEGGSTSHVLSFRDPTRSNPYNVKAIVGLDADELVPNYYHTQYGDNFHELALVKREIVVRVELNPRFNVGESYSSLRDDLYRLIGQSRTGLVKLEFYNEAVDPVAVISGYVIKFEAPVSTETPEVQITIKCKEPMLKASARTDIDISGMTPALITINDTLSTAPHGLVIEAEVVEDGLLIFSVADPSDPTYQLSAAVFGGFLSGDIIQMSSELNNKYLRLVRGSTTFHIADSIQSGSVWPLVRPGNNSFTLEPSEPMADKMDLVSVAHYPTYWGI